MSNINWKPSQSILDYVMKTERFEPKIYKDGKGIETIGYGFTDKKLIKKYRGKKMSEKEARRIFLEEKVPEFTRYVADKTENFDKLSDSQKDDLFSFVYNVGVGNYEDDYPKLHKALVDEDWIQVAQNMDAGYFDEKNPGLRLRRNYERELFGFMSDENGNVIPPLTDDQKADKIQNTLLRSILGVKNDVQLEDRYASTFNEAYKAARKRGDRKFTWGGKEYSAGKYAEGGIVGPDDWTSEDLFNPAYSKELHTSSAQKSRDDIFKRYIEDRGVKNFKDNIVPAIEAVSDFIPVVGDVKAVYDVGDSYRKGDYLTAAIASLGLVPFIGDFAKHGFNTYKRLPDKKHVYELSRDAVDELKSNMISNAKSYYKDIILPKYKEIIDDSYEKLSDVDKKAVDEFYKGRTLKSVKLHELDIPKIIESLDMKRGYDNLSKIVGESDGKLFDFEFKDADFFKSSGHPDAAAYIKGDNIYILDELSPERAYGSYIHELRHGTDATEGKINDYDIILPEEVIDVIKSSYKTNEKSDKSSDLIREKIATNSKAFSYYHNALSSKLGRSATLDETRAFMKDNARKVFDSGEIVQDGYMHDYVNFIRDARKMSDYDNWSNEMLTSQYMYPSAALLLGNSVFNALNDGDNRDVDIKADGGKVGDEWTSEDLFNPVYSRQSYTSSSQRERDKQFKKELENQRIKGFTDYIVPAMTTVADFTPVVGEVKSGMEALRLYTEGHTGEAALASLGAIPAIGLVSRGGRMIGKTGKRSIMPYVRDIPKWLDNLAETTMFPKKLLDAGKWALAEAGDNTGRSIVDVFPATPWAKEIADNASMNAVKRGTNYVEDHYSDPKVQEKIRSVLGDNGYVISPERREALRRAGVIKGDGIDSIDYEKYKEQIPVKIGQPSVVERADHSGYYLPIEEGGEVVVYDRLGPYRRPTNRIAETAAHENNHLMQDIYGLDNWQVRKDGYYVPNTDTEVGRMFEKVMNKTSDDSWYRSPSELHSSIMEYRLSNGIKPGEELSDKAVDEIYRSKKFSKFFDSNAKEEDVKKLIKILPSIAVPAAYSVLSEDDSFSEGGFVGDNYDIAYDYLVGERNLSPKSAIAIMANLENESGMDPSIFNSIGAFGLQQWLGPRKKALIKRYGSNPNLRQQLEFLVDEYEGKNEKTGWNFETKGKNLGTDRFNYYMYSKADFDNAPTIEDATIAWNQGFGRPATHELNNEKRIKSAQRLARRYNMPYLKGSYGQLGVNMDNANKQDVDNFKKDIIGSILPGYVDFEKYDNKAKSDAYVSKSSYAKKVKERSEKMINQQDVDRAKMDFFNLVWNSISFDKIKR